MLAVHDLQIRVGARLLMEGVNFRVDKGDKVGLVGRNGAGKTTLMRSVMGHLPILAGTIEVDGRPLAAMPRHARAGLGIGYMPEDRGLVPELTVEENILVPVWVSRTLRAPERLAFVYEVLPELREMRDRRALLLRLTAEGRAAAGSLPSRGAPRTSAG